MNKLLCALCLISLSGCTIGSGVAGVSAYSIRANEADSLTAKGENRVVWRAKKEIYDEIFKEQAHREKGLIE